MSTHGIERRRQAGHPNQNICVLFSSEMTPWGFLSIQRSNMPLLPAYIWPKSQASFYLNR
jgi:hypothetical protein